MPSPKNGRKKRGSRIDINAYNNERKANNLLHEIVFAEKKYQRLLSRNARGLKRTPGKKIIWDDAHKEAVKINEVPRKQGFPEGSKRAEKLKAHIASLKNMLNKS